MRLWTRVFMLLVCSGYLYAQNSAVRTVQQGPSPLKSASASGSAKNLVDTALVEWVSHYRSNRASGMDIVHDVTLDAEGNVYVTGKSESAENGLDYLTVKYNFLGEEVWRATYDGPLHGVDIANGIAVDEQGNVYVTGLSMGNDGESLQWRQHDFCTIKYNPAGEEQWVRRYNGSSMWSDAGIAIAVDGVGGVYVIGESWQFDSLSSTHSLDYVTIKYGTNGVIEWIAKYNGPVGGDDFATSLAIDDSGSVYVTGRSIDSLSWPYSEDIATVKYNSNGIEHWVQRFDANDWPGSERTISIALDPARNVLVTGSVGGVGTVTLKYSSTGQELWSSTYAPQGARTLPADMEADALGNAYVFAVSGNQQWWHNTGDSLVVLKYSPGGVLLWTASYTDPENQALRASEMAVTDAGDLYLTGSCGGQVYSGGSFHADSIVTLKYTSDGIPQWVRRYNGPGGSSDVASAIAVDEGGNVFVAGSSGPNRNGDFLTIKYKPSGIERWVARTSGEGSSHDYVSAMVVDNAGNVYMTGPSLSWETSWDYFTAKFISAGTLLWEARYDGPAGRIDYPHAIAVDGSGNIFITGESEDVGTSSDWATIKYNAAGMQEWIVRYDGSMNWKDEARLIALDSSSNVYVAGTSNSGARMTTVKYNNNGVQEWIAHFDSSGWVGVPTGLTVDNAGNVYVTGYRWDWGNTGGSTLKYNSAGALQWVVHGGFDVAVDDSGNVYRTFGWSPSSTTKYNSMGEQLWSQSVAGTQLELDNSGNLIVHDPYSGVFSISSMGAIQWSLAPMEGAFTLGFAVDLAGNSYVSGLANYFWNGPARTQSAKIGTSGNIEWITEYIAANNSLLIPQACRVDGFDNVYVAGGSEMADYSSLVTLVKYSQITVSVGEEGSNVPGSYSLSQNYPNPFNPSTAIKFQVPGTGMVAIKVYDLLGREVATLVNDELSPGSYTAEWNAQGAASGVYFYRFEAGSFVESKKLLLLK